MRNRIWNLLSEVKFKALYSSDCHKRSDRYFRFCSLFIAITSASSITAWASWETIPSVWACLVAASQILIVVMPYFPFIKNDTSFLEMSYEFESLYLDVEKLWYSFENVPIDHEESEKQIYTLKEKALKIEQSHKGVYCPPIKTWMRKIDKETNLFITNNFYHGE